MYICNDFSSANVILASRFFLTASLRKDVLSDVRQPEVEHLHFWAEVCPKFRQIVSLHDNTFSISNLVALKHVKQKTYVSLPFDVCSKAPLLKLPK